MKNVKFLLGLLVMLVMLPLAIFAQDVVDPVLDPDVTNYFAGLAGVAALTTLVVSFIKKFLKLTGFLAQSASWVVAIALCYGGWLLKLGLFADVTVAYVPAVYGLAVGLVANGIFNIEFVKTILRLFKLEPPKNAKPK